MREVGLLEVEVEARGSVGRPQHRYTVASDAPSLGLEPAAFPLLARLLAGAAASAGVGGEDAASASREQGRAMAARAGRGRGGAACAESLTRALDELGFDPAMATSDELATIAFTHCPYRELAELHPELVCHLHRGLVEGFVEEHGGADVEQFGTLVDREPCQVVLSLE
jgi:predicted ArsR family transcriptional regulator